MLRAASLVLLSARSAYAQPMAGDACTFDSSAGEPFEFGATFDISKSNVQTWVAQATIKKQYNEGKDDDGETIGWQENVVYADPEMKIIFYPTTGTGEAPFEAVHDCGAGVIETPRASCTDVAAGGTITIAPTTGAGATQPPCYNIKFNEQKLTTHFTLLTTGVDYVAIFAEHGPTEFERGGKGGVHYLMDVDVRGKNDDAAIVALQAADPIEPVFQDGVSNAPPEVKPWGIAIGTSFLVNLCTLIGVIFLAPAIKAKADSNPNTIFALANSFAAGALLAAAFYLMLYEATHLITEPKDTPKSESDGEGGKKWEDDSQEAGRSGWWGSMVLLGFISANIMETVVQAIVEKKGKTSAADATSTDKAPTTASIGNQVRVLCGILLGDFMHNLVDGIFIGAAFVGCNDKVGWTIVAATIYHELAQEVSDYLILTDPMQGNLKPVKALALNFISGLSVVLGAIIVVGAAPSAQVEGLLLAFGGGVYVQIAATECAGRVNNTVKTTMMRLATIAFFCLGATSIGLVLLDHEHCVPGGGGHAH